MQNLRFLWLAVLVGVSLGAGSLAHAKSDEDKELSADAEAEENGKQREHAGRSLAERIPPVTHRVFTKRERVELTPAFGLTLDDPFHKAYIFQGGVAYYLNESFGFGAQGEYYGSSSSNPDISGRPVTTNFNHPVFAGRLELIWAPIYGKVNLFAEEVFHFDTFLSGGAEYIGLNSSGSVAGTLAIGQHYFLNDWLAVRVDLRDQIFSMDANPGSGPGKHLQNLLTFNVGVSFFPTSGSSTE